MSGEGAAGSLAGVLATALADVPGLSSVSDGAPIQAGDASAIVEMGPETDWGHKSGAGAELRFAISIRCGGERPGRTRALLEAARGRIADLPAQLDGWQVVSLVPVRARTVREPGPRWTGMIEYRARMLRS